MSYLVKDKLGFDMHLLSYLFILIIPISVYLSFSLNGLGSFLAVIVAYIFIPLLELVLPKNESKEPSLLSPKLYDLLLYLVSGVHFFLVYYYCITFKDQLSLMEHLGRTLALGISCGVIGINVAHELGHRKEKYHQLTSLILLSTSLYTQFFVEHNKGHHRHVATPQDPATSRLNETVYAFIFRSMWGTLKGAYILDKKEFLSGILIQAFYLLSALYFFNIDILLGLTVGAFFGGINLEVVNYIEHYGLVRKINPSGRYEKVLPQHSWNSNHFLGRKVLFELPRHSDHHAYVSRPYYELRNSSSAPKLPYGYPGMMVLSLVPPLFFKVMNPLVTDWQSKTT